MDKSFFFPALAATMLISGVTVTTSAAGTDRQPAQEVVSYGDLDLNSDSGRRTLQRRIRQAAERVCPDARGSLGRARTLSLECVREVEARAWAHIQEQQQRMARTGAPEGRQG